MPQRDVAMMFWRVGDAMPKAKSKSGKIKRAAAAPAPPRPDFEATAQRLAHAANDSDLVKGVIEKAGERVPLCRRFRDTPLDRLYRAKRITYAQWFAGDWYRSVYEQAHVPVRVVAVYDQQRGGGGSDVGSKLLGSEARYHARQVWRRARATIPAQMLGLVEGLVLHDASPALANGQQRERFGLSIGRALQPVAEWINAPQHA